MDDKRGGDNDGDDSHDYAPRHLSATNYRLPGCPVPPVIAILGHPCRAVEAGPAAAGVDQLVGQSDSSWSNWLPTSPRYRSPKHPNTTSDLPPFSYTALTLRTARETLPLLNS